jgi:imidazolonepropionase-like amidohydrolase
MRGCRPHQPGGWPRRPGRTLLRGSTSVRDMAGPSFSLTRAIDAGQVPGPRIWPSGAMISQTSVPGDFCTPFEAGAAGGGARSRGDAIGLGAIAEGEPEVLRRVREQLMLGASQTKLPAGGGVMSDIDPLDVSQYTEGELHAAVFAAADWDTHVGASS